MTTYTIRRIWSENMPRYKRASVGLFAIPANSEYGDPGLLELSRFAAVLSEPSLLPGDPDLGLS